MSDAEAQHQGAQGGPPKRHERWGLLAAAAAAVFVLAAGSLRPGRVGARQCSSPVDVPLTLSTHVASATHCASPRAGAGHFLLRTHDDARTAVFRLRLAGPQLLLLDVRHVAPRTFTAHYEGLEPGAYHAELLLLFPAYDATRPGANAMLRPAPAVFGGYTFHVSGTPAPAVRDERTLPLCDGSAPLRGRWRLADPSLAAFLAATRFQPPVNVTDNSTWPEGHEVIHGARPAPGAPPPLTFVADGCRIVDYAGGEGGGGALRACAASKKLCVWGDSHIRHLHNELATLLGEAQDVGRWDVAASNFSYYIEKNWAGFGEDVGAAVDAGGCTHVLLNFAHWPAGWPQGFAWTPDQYAAYVAADLALVAAAAAARPALRVLWVSANPVGFMDEYYDKSMFTSPPTEFRADPLLEAYNAAAAAAAVARGFRVVDSWAAALPLKDLAYDYGHYRGAVGWTAANLALTGICGGT